jgi:hypothetical protein
MLGGGDETARLAGVARHSGHFTTPTFSLFTFERYDEFNRRVGLRSGGSYCTSYLQVAPMQRTVGAVESDNHTSLRPFDAHFHEALEKGGSVEIK